MSIDIYCTINFTKNQLKWKAHYDKLIERGKNRCSSKEEAKQFLGYVESHHIIPKCMNGLDNEENIVHLTAREHYVAHQLLVKIYPGNIGLTGACKMMCISKDGSRVNNRFYEWLKINFAIDMSKAKKGVPRTEECKKNISIALQNMSQEKKDKISYERRNPTQETRDRLSKWQIGKKLSKETREKISITVSNRDQSLTDQCVENMRLSNIGRKHSAEIREKMSQAQRGKIITEEHKLLISKTLKTYSDEQELEVLELYKNNNTRKEISLKTDIKYKIICTIVRNNLGAYQ